MIKIFNFISFVLCTIFLLSKNCNAQRIVGGSETNIADIPYQAVVRVGIDGICGGSIINHGWILSAAHCVFNRQASEIVVHVGSNTTTGGLSVFVQKIFIHNQYTPETKENDVALLQLTNKLVFSNTTFPRDRIKLSRSLPPDDSIVLVSGYGRTSVSGPLSNTLMSVKVNVINKQTCNTAYSGGIKNGMFCAAAPNKDSCQGDSGGPVAFNNELVGVVSWGWGCANPNYPGVYSDVSYYYDWITDTVFQEA